MKEAQEPRSSKAWLQAIKDAEKSFSTYQDKCDNIDKHYADLATMSKAIGDREFKIFWANLEVLRPTIYSRPPQPVVMPRHREGRELYRSASEMLERALAFDVENDDLHETLCLVRDDLAVGARGVAWVLDSGHALHVDRRDFVHEPARKWSEVGWVARRAYLSRDEGVARFGDVFHGAKFEHLKGEDDGHGNDYQTTGKKAAVWEIWSKTEQAVIWVTEGIDEALDEQPPLYEARGFFPCPRPAYGTLERGTLRPVPDFVYYRDQVDEINELTARIAALSESLRLKGFYASGTSEIGEAVEAAMRQTDNKAILVPISNFAAFGDRRVSDAIVWLPVDQVIQVITSLVQLRKQLIEDVYEITGLSDIMRGSTEASETATAQNLKAQYGSVRVKMRQAEMARMARDVIRLKAEVFSEIMPVDQLAQMADMQLPDPAAKEPITLEMVGALLSEQRVRPFVLEVETDSTIAPNEEAEKKSRMEFIQAMGGFIQSAGPMVERQPETAPFAAELMKFTAGAFRAGRELGGPIDEFADMVKQKAAQAGQAPDPAQIEAQAKAQEAQVKTQLEQEKHQLEVAKFQAEREDAQREYSLEWQKVAGDLMQSSPEFTQALAVAVAQAMAGVVEAIQQGNAQLSQQVAQVGTQVQAGNEALHAKIAAPKRVVRDENGRVAGVEVVH